MADKNAAAVGPSSLNQTPHSVPLLVLPTSSSSTSSSSAVVVGALTSTGGSGSNSGFSSEIQSGVSSSSSVVSQSGDCINRSVQLTSCTFSSTTTSTTPSTSQTFPFEYGEDNTDYLLMEEEVFNKVTNQDEHNISLSL